MAIKAGQILHDANGFVVDRIQTGGVSNLNIPEEKVYELGNYKTVATTRDIPDLSFDVESLDVSTEMESILLGLDPTATVDGDEFNFTRSMPVDVISPFKAGNGAYDIVRGLGIPYLTLETATYRFGLRQNATQSFTLRGDSIYYIPGTPYYAEYAVAATPVGPYAFANAALPYEEAGETIYALSVCLKNEATGAYRRLFHGVDYTDTAADFTLLAAPSAGYDRIHVVYGSATPATYAQTVHQDVSVKPAAVRGKDLDVFMGDVGNALGRWTGVQSFEVSRRVNLDNDEEFGNRHYVAQDYDTADVTGSITVRAASVEDLWAKIHQITGTPTNEIVGPYVAEPQELELRVNHPETGDRMKTLYVPDARFQVPAIQGRVQTKLEVTFNFTSDAGDLLVFQGARA